MCKKKIKKNLFTSILISYIIKSEVDAYFGTFPHASNNYILPHDINLYDDMIFFFLSAYPANNSFFCFHIIFFLTYQVDLIGNYQVKIKVQILIICCVCTQATHDLFFIFEIPISWHIFFLNACSTINLSKKIVIKIRCQNGLTFF